jgi:uncharacterized protein YcbK (DUF882 family)
MLNAAELLNPKNLTFVTNPSKKVVKIKDKSATRKKFSQSDYDRMQRQRDEGYEIKEIAKMNDCSRDTVMRNTTAKKIPKSTPLWRLPHDIRENPNKEYLISFDGKIIGKFTPIEEN